MRELIEALDQSTDDVVVEYAVQELMKRKTTTVAKAAAATAEKLSGGTNLFIGGGVDIVKIDVAKLEAALWDRIVAKVRGYLSRMTPGSEDFAIGGAVDLYGLTTADERKLRKLMEA